MNILSSAIGSLTNPEKLKNTFRTVKKSRINFRQFEQTNPGSSRYYIQSAYALPDEAKRIQEIRPFRKIDDSFKEIAITKDIVQPYYDDYGILTANIYDFLLDPRFPEK